MKLVLMSVMCMGLVLPGVVSDSDDIKCYAGVGEVGDSAVKETGGHKSCSVSAVEAAGHRVVARLGLSMKMDAAISALKVLGAEVKKGETCFKGDVPKIGKGEICYCNTTLCNSAPATVAAFMTMIAMALMAKFLV